MLSWHNYQEIKWNMCKAAGTNSVLPCSCSLNVFLCSRAVLAYRQCDSPDIVIHQVFIGKAMWEKFISIAVVRWEAWGTRDLSCMTVTQ
jgi:hypothetical protein